MTYREKLQKEHPEMVNDKWYGGCHGCPKLYDYGPEMGPFTCGGMNEEKCTKCWDTVIPGTEDKQYENWTRDELMRLIRNYEVRDDAHEKRHEDDRKEIELLKEESEIKFKAKDNIIDNLEKRNEELEQKIQKLEQKNKTYSRTCDIYKSKDAIIEKQEKEIKVLKADNAAADIIIKERDQKIQKLEGACSAKNAEILRLDKELKEEKTRKYFWCEDNCCAMVKDKEIQRLSKLLGDRDDEIQELKRKNENQAEYIRRAKVTFVERDKQIDELQQKLKHAEANVAAYQLMARSSFGTLCPCHCSGCDEKDKEIERLKKDLKVRRFNEDFWYDEYLRLSKKVGELVNSNQELKDALAKEKSEHAKHHGISSLFRIID